MKNSTFTGLLSAIALGFLAIPAQAASIGSFTQISPSEAELTVSGGAFDGTTWTLSLSDPITGDDIPEFNMFQTELESTPWWQDQAFAFEVAQAWDTGDRLDLFVWDTPTSNGYYAHDFSLIADNSLPGRNYAFAVQQTATVPEPLTILGAATAVAFGTGFKRKLGKANKK